MNSIEFFRPESQRPLDADGFELPEWLNPFFAIPPADPCEECEEPREDDQDAADWPTSEEIDGDRWEPGPEYFPALDNPNPPSPADEAWLASQNADDEDWPSYAAWSQRLEELHQASEWQDRIEAIYHTDQDDDVTAAGLPIG
jgi:hypothetical protein